MTSTPAAPPPAAAPTEPAVQWRPIDVLGSRLEANLAALATRNPALADRVRAAGPAGESFVVTSVNDRVVFGRVTDHAVQVLPNPVPPAHGRQIAGQVFPDGHATEAVLVAGLDQGWIWDALYNLPTKSPLPNFKPPLYLLCHDVTKLWLALHVHDWRAPLADPRAMMFVGSDAVAQLQAALSGDPSLPVPRLSLTVEPALWSAGQSAESVYRAVLDHHNRHLQQALATIAAAFPTEPPAALAEKLRTRRLRVLGITSRFTTFLQYSMRDWLAAFDALGHETRLVIEPHAHGTMTNVVYLDAVATFKPDLILLIDHYRAEFPGLPASVPCAMWVQDFLPNIFRPSAGAAQGERDYCLGLGKLLLCHRHRYPRRRFMHAVVGANPARFAQVEVGRGDAARYACDVAFVSHAAVSADAHVREEAARTDELTRRLLWDVYERLRAVYDAGQCLQHPLKIRAVIDDAMRTLGLAAGDDAVGNLASFFGQRVNNALFRHQALHWAADAGVDLRLYGRGWESHPTLGKYARGVADNDRDLASVYRHSRVNLQIVPSGPLHQRLFEGIAAGAFFLVRAQPADRLDDVYRRLAAWCDRHGVTDDAALRHRATPEAVALVDEVRALIGLDPFALEFPLTDEVRLSAETDFALNAAGALPHYDAVAFAGKAELHDKLRRYLAATDERARVVADQRRAVIDRYTYTGVTRRLLRFVADDLVDVAGQAGGKAA